MRGNDHRGFDPNRHCSASVDFIAHAPREARGFSFLKNMVLCKQMKIERFTLFEMERVGRRHRGNFLTPFGKVVACVVVFLLVVIVTKVLL